MKNFDTNTTGEFGETLVVKVCDTCGEKDNWHICGECGGEFQKKGECDGRCGECASFEFRGFIYG